MTTLALYDAWMAPGGIRELRRQLGVSQAQLAALIAVSPTAVSRWERGVRPPTIIYLVRLRRLYRERLEAA